MYRSSCPFHVFAFTYCLARKSRCFSRPEKRLSIRSRYHPSCALLKVARSTTKRRSRVVRRQWCPLSGRIAFRVSAPLSDRCLATPPTELHWSARNTCNCDSRSELGALTVVHTLQGVWSLRV